MNEPTLHKTSWQVYTTNVIYQHAGGPMDVACWAWVAHGPRGSKSGVERDPGTAVHKAGAAAYLLADPMMDVATAKAA